MIYATLHKLPCICIIMAPAGTFFTFILVAGNKGEKKKLSTCFQNMFWNFWKAFLLFGELRYSSQFAVYMHHNGSGGYFFTFLLVAGKKCEKKKLSTCQNMFWNFWNAFLLFGEFRYSSQFAVYMHHNGSGGYFFHFSSSCWKYS